MATSYANAGGTGDRTATITVTTTLGSVNNGSALVNGNTSDSSWYLSAGSATATIEFWFQSKKIIDEARFYQSNTTTHGTYKWQGSNDRATWTDIGGTFALGGATTQTFTTLSGNTTGYVFYRLFQTAGNNSSSPYIHEFEFKIEDGGGGSYTHSRGSGNRSATITTSVGGGMSWFGGSAANLVNGTFDSVAWGSTSDLTGYWIKFDLGSSYVVQQAKYWFSGGGHWGNWKLQGSPDDSAWTDLSGTTVLNNTGTDPSVTCFSTTNTTGYRYYRFLGVSGTGSGAPFHQEVEFMVADATTTAIARLSQLPVEAAVLSDVPVAFRLSQLPVEVGILDSVPVSFRLSQLAVEVLINTSIVPPTVTEKTQFMIIMP